MAIPTRTPEERATQGAFLTAGGPDEEALATLLQAGKGNRQDMRAVSKKLDEAQAALDKFALRKSTVSSGVVTSGGQRKAIDILRQLGFERRAAQELTVGGKLGQLARTFQQQIPEAEPDETVFSLPSQPGVRFFR